MSSPKCIGIIGGMGPRATVRFEQKLVDAFEGNDQSRPDVICFNIGRIPDRTDFLLGNGPDPAPLIRTIARRAERSGATLLAMPCNTAHAPQIFGRVEPGLTTPLLNMPKLTLQRIAGQKISRALILATNGTLVSNTFVSSRTIFPDVETQQSVMNIIHEIKAGKEPPVADIAIVKTEIRRTKADAVVLACTELSFLAENLANLGINVIDTLDVLAEACVEYIKQGEPNGHVRYVNTR